MKYTVIGRHDDNCQVYVEHVDGCANVAEAIAAAVAIDESRMLAEVLMVLSGHAFEAEPDFGYGYPTDMPWITDFVFYKEDA